MKLIDTLPEMPCRRPDCHKGDNGKILMVAGSTGMSGAAYLCSMGALRSGAGLVYLAVPKSQQPILASKLTEVITFPMPETYDGTFAYKAKERLVSLARDIDVVVVGPGISRNNETIKLVQDFLLACRKPVVIDADGLNAISDAEYIPRMVKSIANSIILTPHAGEMARLINKSGAYVQHNRQKVSVETAKKHRIIIALKGYQTIVTDGKRIYINDTGNPGMATAGSGDVLTGIIAGLLGQKLPDFQATQLAVYLHGKAGDLAAKDLGQHSLIASDLLKYLTRAMRTLSK
ncbi:MAG: NAD(P)H-hydrate dehydratase [Candidatus Brocadiia bacterium]